MTSELLPLGTPAGTRLHFFSLAGDGKRNKRIDQCLHWSMKAPQGLSIMIRVPIIPYK